MLTSVVQCSIGLDYLGPSLIHDPRTWEHGRCRSERAWDWWLWALGFPEAVDPVPGGPGEGVFGTGVKGFRAPDPPLQFSKTIYPMGA